MRKTIIVCDFEHGPDDDFVASSSESFQVGETTYYLDLCGDHVMQFKAFIDLQARWVRSARTELDPDEVHPAAARRTPGDRARTPDNRAIRAWAAANHLNIGPRGRIPESVRTQWVAAGSPKLSQVAEPPVAQPEPEPEPYSLQQPNPAEPGGPLSTHPAVNRSFLRR